MGQRFGQYDLIIYFRILTSSILEVPGPQFGYIPSTDLLVSEQKFHPSNLCSDNFIFENGTDFKKYNFSVC